MECHNTKIGEIAPGVPPNGAKLFFSNTAKNTKPKLLATEIILWASKTFQGCALLVSFDGGRRLS